MNQGRTNLSYSVRPVMIRYVRERFFCVYVVLCVGGELAVGWSSVQGVLPTEYKIKKLKMRAMQRDGEIFLKY
jgi:hypothetical protein